MHVAVNSIHYSIFAHSWIKPGKGRMNIDMLLTTVNTREGGD